VIRFEKDFTCGKSVGYLPMQNGAIVSACRAQLNAPGVEAILFHIQFIAKTMTV